MEIKGLAYDAFSPMEMDALKCALRLRDDGSIGLATSKKREDMKRIAQDKVRRFSF